MEQSLLSTAGRIRRKTYWTRWAIGFIVLVGLSFLSQAIAMPMLYIIGAIPCGIFLIIQGVKRMHDVDKSGWFVLVPIYNLVLALTDGTPHANSYGDDPKGRTNPMTTSN